MKIINRQRKGEKERECIRRKKAKHRNEIREKERNVKMIKETEKRRCESKRKERAKE